MISLKISNEERRNGDIEERRIAQQLRKGMPVGLCEVGDQGRGGECIV